MSAVEQSSILRPLRRSPVETIAALAPNLIGFLQVPLTPSRQAALAAFTARTGIPAQQLAADLLDDVIMAKPCADHAAEASAIADFPSADAGLSSAIADQPSIGGAI